ncbi:MAG: LapA family protein [Alicyclobacillus macrosporangiidus]|uniref:LapA family protein n=1 Tax=Alicyclobacillus macrosporangiidus TaxID=392015 RepID=UPI0026EEC943|nr:LapA family protein [Alicyclobacillus macrosporangiidus]MCL6600776.1 LapA family protein [Alicyclobacillus macrosporangiidus]
MRWKVLWGAIFAVLVAVFTLVNAQPVTVNLIVRRVDVNLVLVILGSVLIGMVLMAALWSMRAWRLRGERLELQKRVAELEAELEWLRAAAAAAGDGANDSEQREGDGALGS